MTLDCPGCTPWTGNVFEEVAPCGMTIVTCDPAGIPLIDTAEVDGFRVTLRSAQSAFGMVMASFWLVPCIKLIIIELKDSESGGGCPKR